MHIGGTPIIIKCKYGQHLSFADVCHHTAAGSFHLYEISAGKAGNSSGKGSERIEMEKARITLKDIAAECGYSVNTVSRALRGGKGLSDATVALIRDTADRLGYIPNSMASSLRSGHTQIIAVIVNDLHNQHFCDLIESMDRILRENHYTLMILCMQLEDDLAEKLIHTAISLSVDGILYFPTLGQRNYIEYMTDNRMPFVLLDRRVNNVDADTVRCDDEQGGYLAGQHLAALGHKKYLFLSGLELSSSQIDRLKGFMRAMEEYGIPQENVRVIPGAQVEEALSGNRLEECLFPMDYTAIVCFRDEVAYPVLHDLLEKRIRIPEDISLISFDNLHAQNPSRPAVTSIYTDGQSIAELSVKLLLERIEDPSLPPRNMILPVRIFDEGTTAAPGSGGAPGER